MKNLQRELAWYKLALEAYMTSKNGYGVCNTLAEVAPDFKKLWLKPGGDSKVLLPNLYKDRVTMDMDNTNFWFYSDHERVWALRKCITRLTTLINGHARDNTI
jgi:hypothetical protein